MKNDYMIDLSGLVLVCPRNDEESMQILKIAKKINLATVISRQPHGANLDREPRLLERIKEANLQVARVILVELPGPAVEQELKNVGFETIIIDHHQYEGLDRSNEFSSLEQFLRAVEISADELQKIGFDPFLVKAVAIMDSEFIWGLRSRGYCEEDICRILTYWRAMTLELGDERRMREEDEALVVWTRRKEEGDLIIVESDRDDISIRDALSFLVEKTYHKPRTLCIRQGSRRIYVQDIDVAIARKLHKKFGGFLFGKDACWGMLADQGQALPTLDQIIKFIQNKS